MKRLIAVLAALAVVVAMIAVPAFSATTRTVKVGPHTRFTRHDRTLRTLTIRRGDKITFEYSGRLRHNVRISRGPRTGTIAGASHRSGYEKTKTFTRAGTYTIVCDIHAPNMKFTLHVR